MIVGHKIDTYLTAVGQGVARHGVRRFSMGYTITEHVEVRELHATKGWRLIQHRRKDQKVGKLPPIDEWRACDTTTFIRKAPDVHKDGTPKMPKWSRPAREIKPKELMRHRERRRDIQIAENKARNKLEDQRLAGLR